MIKELIIGTTNPAKTNQVRGALLPLNIQISDLSGINLPDVKEDGQTAQENARKKAESYSKFLNKTVLSMDNSLFFDDLPSEKQPGIFVRRINGQTDRCNDSEMLNHYVNLVSKLGEQTKGRWEFAVCIANGDKISETTLISPRIFTKHPSPVMIPGFPLESIQIDPDTGKYISEMTQNEQDIFWQRAIGQKLQEFIKNIDF